MGFDGQEVASASQTIDLDIDIEGTILSHTFYVMDDLAEEIIIGADMMQTWKISLDMESETVSIDPRFLFLICEFRGPALDSAMGAIVKNYTVNGTRGSDTIRLDMTPSAGLFHPPRHSQKLGAPVPLVCPTRFAITDGPEEVTAETCLSLNIPVDGILLWHWFYVVDGLDEELIAGADMIRKRKISLDLDNETVCIDPSAEDLNRRTGIAIAIPVSGE